MTINALGVQLSGPPKAPNHLVGVEAEQVESEAGLEKGGESWRSGAVDCEQIVLLRHRALVVGDHEVVVGHRDGQPVQDGGREPPLGQRGIVRRGETELCWSWEVG